MWTPSDARKDMHDAREKRDKGYIGRYGHIPKSTRAINGVPPRIGGRCAQQTSFTLRSNQGGIVRYTNDVAGYDEAWADLIEWASEREEKVVRPEKLQDQTFKEMLKETGQDLKDIVTAPLRLFQGGRRQKQPLIQDTQNVPRVTLNLPPSGLGLSSESLACVAAASHETIVGGASNKTTVDIASDKMTFAVAGPSKPGSETSNRDRYGSSSTDKTMADSRLSYQQGATYHVPQNCVGKGKGRAVDVQPRN